MIVDGCHIDNKTVEFLRYWFWQHMTKYKCPYRNSYPEVFFTHDTIPYMT